jgi:hypothetical protein
MGNSDMRKLLMTVTVGALVAGLQTAAVAQPAQGSRAYCEAKWNAAAGAHTESYDAFMDKCMSCEAKWDDMVATNTTEGQDRSEYLKKCSRGAYWVGGGTNLVAPGIGLAVLGGGLLYIALDNDHDHPVSP